MSKVKVILQADVAGLGEVGEVKDVAGGYARNYLMPRKLVVPATKGNINALEQQRTRIAVRQEQTRTDARAVADKMAGLHLEFDVRVGEQGRLYGSVTGQDIASRLKDEYGIEIDRRLIELKETLRALGEFDVPVRIAHAVTGHLKVTLRDQNAPRVVAQAPVAAAAESDAASGRGNEGESIDADAKATSDTDAGVAFGSGVHAATAADAEEAGVL